MGVRGSHVVCACVATLTLLLLFNYYTPTPPHLRHARLMASLIRPDIAIDLFNTTTHRTSHNHTTASDKMTAVSNTQPKMAAGDNAQLKMAAGGNNTQSDVATGGNTQLKMAADTVSTHPKTAAGGNTQPKMASVGNVSLSGNTQAVATKKSDVVLAGSLYEAGHTAPHPELCPSLGAHLRLLILITSAPSHAEARAGVRLTWGHFAARADVALAFLVGATSDKRLSAALDEEDNLYGDVIRGKFVDSYGNLTLKTLSMLEWVDTYCPRAPHVLKTDDDMFVNVPRLLDFAKKHEKNTRTIYGKVVRKWGPNRSTKSKYYVSKAQFPGKMFPEFATGPAYLLTADCVRPLLERALLEPFLRLEDVFITGVVAQRLGLKRVHSPEFLNRKLPPHACTVQRAISLHMVRYPDQFDLWRKLLDHKAKCAPK